MTDERDPVDRDAERKRRAELEAELEDRPTSARYISDVDGNVRPAPNARGRAVDTPRRPRPEL